MVEPFGAIGWSADGHLVQDVGELPAMAVAERVVVGPEWIEINGWIFPFRWISKPWLLWFRQVVTRWSEADKALAKGILIAFEARLSPGGRQ